MMPEANINLKGCVEIYPANISMLIREKEKRIAIISMVSASLSLFGSVSILGFILWKRLLRVKNILPLFHLSLADGILAMLWILTTAKYFADNHVNPAFTALSCFIWQLLTEITHFATIFLTINYAIDVYLKMRDRVVKVHTVTEGIEIPESKAERRFKKLLYILSWSVPFLIMMPVIVNIRSNRISACQKCVIFIDVAVLIDDTIPWDYGYIALAVTLTISIIILAVVYILSLKQYWKAVPGFRTDRQRRQLYNMQIRVTVYMLVFIVCWAPGIIIAYHKWLFHATSREKGFKDITRNKYQIIYLLQAAFAPLQGFFNSIVYGWTKKTFRRSPVVGGQGDVFSQNSDLVTPYYDFASSVSDDDNDTTKESERNVKDNFNDPTLGF